jgi:uncharacterized RDD family membrane protein YckC
MDEEKVIRNLDGEIIDFTKDDLIEKLTYESANLLRRFLAFLVDVIILIAIWFLSTRHLFREIDAFMETLGLSESDYSSLDLFLQFRDLLWQLYLKIFIYWLFIKTAYFTLIPAIIGNGQTIGKLIAGIGTVDLSTLEEISATRLVFREFVCRGLLETVLLIPYLVSVIMVLFRKDSRCLHDVLAKTVVIKLDLYNIN